jgi:hypothetical protein
MNFTSKEFEEKLDSIEKGFDPNTKTVKTWYGLKFKMEMKEDVEDSYVNLIKRRIIVKKENDLKSTLQSALANIYSIRFLPVTLSVMTIPIYLSLLGKIDFAAGAIASLGAAYLSKTLSEEHASSKIRELYVLDKL